MVIINCYLSRLNLNCLTTFLLILVLYKKLLKFNACNILNFLPLSSKVGDGTTSVVVLASELLREAEKLVSFKLHPQTIIAGYRKATDIARKALDDAAVNHSNDADRFRSDLIKIANTTLSSKILSQHKDFFSEICVDAVLRLKGSGNLDAIKIIKKQGGTLSDSFLDKG